MPAIALALFTVDRVTGMNLNCLKSVTGCNLVVKLVTVCTDGLSATVLILKK